MMKRVLLFILTNILVVVTLSFVLSILGVQPYLTESGISYANLAMFCLVWGMGGAFISLAMSRMMAKWMMGVQVITPEAPGQFAWLVNSIQQLSKKAQLPAMPEIGIYDSPEVNAFATGPMKSRSLVAVSTGLLNRMSRDEIEGVLAHEIAHIQNGDMVTMTLIQGVINAFVMFFARIISFAVSQSVREESQVMVRMLVTIVLEIVLGLLGYLVVAWFSRQREFRADAGGAALSGRGQMTAALQSLQRLYGAVPVEGAAASIATMKISGKSGGLMALMATHPPLEERIARLQRA